MHSRLKAKIASAPNAPGVYLMKNKPGDIIYIGKAKSIKKRLVTYLGRDLSSKTLAQMSHVCGIEFRRTPTEAMALLLEASLIRQYKPRYNVIFRDDKSYPMVKISNEEFPSVFITRRRLGDGARYFGPYTDPKLLRQALKSIRRYFPYRTCKVMPKKACIYYRIGLSPAPCIGKINKSDYGKIVDDIALILEGRADQLIARLYKQMKERANAHDFEQAARIRDQIGALSTIANTQSLSGSLTELEDLINLLKLKNPPLRIEAFDISNIQGREAVGAMVSFYNARPDKSNYRKFRIKTVEGVNDYAMLAEVVRRRYRRLVSENKPLPGLILIDGGRQHLLIAAKELRNLNLKIPLASIAKEEEHIYLQDKAIPIKLNSDTPALNLIRKMRDEAHRFALAYHHLLRRKKIIGR